MAPVVAAFAAIGALWGGFIGVGAIVATTLGAIVVGGIAGTLVGFAIEELMMPDMANSPTYKDENPVYTVAEGTPIAKAYGRCQLAGNIIRSNDPAETTLKIIIGHGQGEIDSILSWKINYIEWDSLQSVKWYNAAYAGSVHWKNTLLGTDSQSVIQVDGADLFTLDACAHRGISHTGFKLKKNSQISGMGSILVEGKFALCEPIGGGADVFSRNPAVVMWDFYRKIEGYEIAELDINAFTSLETLCDFYPTTGDGGPIRPPGPNNTTVKATSTRDPSYKCAPFFSFDINLPLDGTNKYNQWSSDDGETTQQRLNVDLGVPVVLTKIVLVNSHTDGAYTTKGIQNFVIQGSNTAADLDHVTYADGASGWADVQTGLTATQYDVDDPYKDYVVASPGTAYRYYSIKIADSHGGSTWMGVRDICFWGRSPRYTFDFNFDTEVNINDAKKLIWSSFNGRVIRSQGKLKPVWDWKTMADGSGGLTTKTSQYSFTMDNIARDSFTWHPRKRANKIIIEYLDSSEKWKKTPVTEKDDPDIDDRGVIELKSTAYYITQTDVAARRCRRQLYRAMYADFQCELTGFPSSQKLEVYDLVEVTHTLPDWTAKQFIILDKAEDEQGRPTFLLETYYAGVFDDLATPIPGSYYSKPQNPYDPPPPSTGITATLVGPGGGYDYCAVKVAFTPPGTYLFYSHTIIYASRDDTTYYCVGESSGEDFVINGMGTLYYPGDTCYVKLTNVSTEDVAEEIPDDYDASVVITDVIQMASFYAGIYDFWGGNAAIDHADTKIVIGNLDGTEKIALGVSADAITFAGTQAGFYVDGDGNLRVGGSTHGLKFDAGTGVLEVPTKVRVGTGTYIDIDGTNARIRSSNYVSGYAGAGFTLEPDLLEVGNIACRGIFRAAVFQKDTISVIGGNFLVRPGDVLATDMTAADNSTLTIEGNETFAIGDFLRIKDGTDDEWLEVTNISSAPTYTVTRDSGTDYAANSNPAWKKGATVVNYGASGKGGIYMTSSETNAPYMSMFTHAGSPWDTITTRLRIGNLNGFLGYSSELYGIAIGETNKYLKYDPTNGLRIKGDIDISSMYALPSDEDLVGYWAFDDGSGTVAVDSSGNDNDGTITGSTWATGHVGKSIKVETGFVEMDTSVSAPLTLVFWFQGTTDTDGLSGWLFGLYQDASNNIIFCPYLTIPYIDPVGYVTQHTHETYNFLADNWYMGVFKLSTTNATFEAWKDNEIVQTWSDDDAGFASYNFTKLYLSDFGSNCYHDECRLYDVILTASEIKALYLYPAGSGSVKISGGQITCDNLSAISADLGSITAGTITMPNTGWIKGGQTAYATGTGFFLGYSGAAYKFSFGSSTKYIKWDGTDLAVSGNIIWPSDVIAPSIVGDYEEVQSRANAYATGTTWAKVKEIRVSRDGALTIEFRLAGTTPYAAIRRNGVEIGIVRTASGTYTQDIYGWGKGDLLQIYAKYDAGGSATIDRLYMYSGNPYIAVVTLD